MIYSERPGRSESPTWAKFEAWHDLFDVVCTTHGYSGSGELAYQLCRKTGRLDRKGVEAMTRNVSNWRKGNHAPSRENLRFLSEILDIGQDPVLEGVWKDLYQNARQRPTREEKHVEISLCVQSADSIFRLNGSMYIGAAFGSLITSAIFGIYLSTMSGSTNDGFREALFENRIVWREGVTIRVGEKVVVHGHRGECGKTPPSAEKVKSRLPGPVRIGTLIPGELGIRNSRNCGGPTPAREVIFVATTPGTEDFVLFGDPVTITVVE